MPVKRFGRVETIEVKHYKAVLSFPVREFILPDVSTVLFDTRLLTEDILQLIAVQKGAAAILKVLRDGGVLPECFPVYDLWFVAQKLDGKSRELVLKLWHHAHCICKSVGYEKFGAMNGSIYMAPPSEECK